MLRIVLALVVAFPSLAGGLPEAGRSWKKSAEAQFMTSEERREWEALRTDAEMRRFIETFRGRRTTDFAEEVRKRAAIVDERLALGEAKASTTTRGRIVLLLGAPADLHVRHIPKSSGGNTGHPLESRKGGATDQLTNKTSIVQGGAGWVEYTFRYAPRPELGIGPEGWTVTIEANAASGTDRVKSRRDRERLEKILDAAARNSLHRE